MPFNVAFVKDKKTGTMRVFKSTAASKKDLEDSLEDSRKAGFEDEEAVELLVFDSNMAEILSRLCQFERMERELMEMLLAVRNVAR